MRLSRPLAPAAAVSASPSHANSDATRLGLKPPRDHPTNRKGRDRASRHRHGASNPPTSRQVPSSPLAHNVMTIRSRSSSSKNSDDLHKTSPLHRTASNKVRKTNGNHQVNINSTIRIGPKPKASRPKYQGSPAFSTTPVKTVSQVNRSDPYNCHAQQRKVLAKPKSQPIFKKALVNTFTNMTASSKTDDKTTLPPAAPNPVANVSHSELAPQSKQHHIAVPTSANLAKRKFVDTWIASQKVYTEARAARLARGVPPPQAYTSGNGIEYLVHSPLPFAPPMDHLPELESDVWSAGDLVDLQMGALRKQPLFGIPSNQENRRPDPLPVQAHHVTDIKATMPENGDMDDMALLDVGSVRGQDDASSESSGRTVVPQGQDLNALPSLVMELASSGKQSPPKALARQDSAVMFATVHIDSPKPFVVSHDDKGYRAVPGWAVVPCSDLSANGLGDEFLLV